MAKRKDAPPPPQGVQSSQELQRALRAKSKQTDGAPSASRPSAIGRKRGGALPKPQAEPEPSSEEPEPADDGAVRNKAKKRKQELSERLQEQEKAMVPVPVDRSTLPAASKKQKRGPNEGSSTDSEDSDGEGPTTLTGAEERIANGKGATASGKAAGAAADAQFKNKEKVLVLSTRGITSRYRHLMDDLLTLLPHSKKDCKLDTKSDRGVLNEVADMKSCSSVVFFEVRKKQDLYVWLSKTPHGPSVKFHVTNVHTMAELKLSGNHLKGSRPVLSFHKAFDDLPHLQLLKEVLAQVFTTPRRHHKSKPFIDHVITFGLADNRIWVRNYQLVVPMDKKRPDTSTMSMVEVGPRMCLNPVKIFAGSFGGATLYENPAYTSPNATRSALKRAKAGKYVGKVAQKAKRKTHLAENPLPHDELDDTFR